MPMPRKEKEKGGFDGRDADYRAINLREMGRPAERANERARPLAIGLWGSPLSSLPSFLSCTGREPARRGGGRSQQ